MDTAQGTLEVDADDADIVIKHAALEKIMADVNQIANQIKNNRG